MAKRPIESTVQDFVYNIDVGFGLRVVQIGLSLLFLLTVLLIFTATQFRGLKDAEAMDYAQLGRNLMTHKAFITQNIRPASMARLRAFRPALGDQIDRHPDLYNAPLYPLVLAAGFRLGRTAFAVEKIGDIYPPERWIVLPINLLFTLLTGIFVYRIARRLFSFRIAALTLATYFLSYTIWYDGISGLGLSMVSFFTSGAFYFALRSSDAREERASVARWLVPFAISALFAGAAALTRYAAMAFVPGLLLYVWLSFGRGGWRWAALYGVLVLICLTPWFARNTLVSGNPFGMALHTALHDSSISPEDLIERQLKPNLPFAAVVRALQLKWVSGVNRLFSERLFSYGEGILFPLFIAALFFRFIRRDVQRFRWSLVVSMLSLLVVAGFFGDGTFRLLCVCWPFVILYGFAFFFLLLDRLQFRVPLFNIALIALIVLLSAAPLVVAILPPRVGIPYPPYFPPFILHVSRLLRPEEVLCTDMPWATAWYGARKSVYLPPTLDEFYEFHDYRRRISGIYFTTLTRDRPYIRTLKTGSYKSWFPILEGRMPNDFPFKDGFPLNNLDQLFLTDRPRWADRQP
jgi:hypothetical protein